MGPRKAKSVANVPLHSPEVSNEVFNDTLNNLVATNDAYAAIRTPSPTGSASSFQTVPRSVGGSQQGAGEFQKDVQPNSGIHGMYKAGARLTGIQFQIEAGDGQVFTVPAPSMDTVGRLYMDMTPAEKPVFFAKFSARAAELTTIAAKEAERSSVKREAKRRAEMLAEAEIAAQMAEFRAKLVIDRDAKETAAQIEAAASLGLTARLAAAASAFVSPPRGKK